MVYETCIHKNTTEQERDNNNGHTGIRKPWGGNFEPCSVQRDLFTLWFNGSLMAALQVLCCAPGLGLLFSSVIWHWYPVWWERKGWRRNFKTGKMEYDKTDSSGFTNTIKNSGLVGKNVKSTQGRWRVTQKAISEVYTHKEHTQVLEHTQCLNNSWEDPNQCLNHL